MNVQHFDVFMQVALHLLSEREKDDLAQLVDTMVSYSITYKNLKFEPQTSMQRHEEASDAPVLSFDPPIGDFVNYKVEMLTAPFKACGMTRFVA